MQTNTVKNNAEPLLKTWYHNLRAQNIENARAIKKKIGDEVELEENQPYFLEFLLYDFRYHILLEQFDKAQVLLERIESFKPDINGKLTYYYHFFKGQYAYDQDHLDEALENYLKAENELMELNDEIELAEFHYKMGSVYFHLDYLTTGIQCANRAMKIFKQYDEFEKRVADCKVLLGACYKDLKMFDQGLEFYESAKVCYEKIEDHQHIRIVNVNTGRLLAKKGDSVKAIHFYELGLENVTEYRLPILFSLAEEYFKVGNISKGMFWLDKGKEIVAKTNNQIYNYEFSILEAEYLNTNDIKTVLEEAILYYVDQGLWEYVKNYGISLAELYEEIEDYKKASEYYRLSSQARKKVSLRGK
ncbi:hypothetical protein [Scopulibacillus darangshiensis]|uniref:response regulator aspartate phosphatase n=1 Tax=Scopulibacillus darangshiensis TaxID=442528 RepID=UPI001FB5287B|nr:hypothetical protein [Scopulibacillus darangshiensis]